MTHANEHQVIDDNGHVLASCATPARARALADEINTLREDNAAMREAISETLKTLPDSFVMTRNTLKAVILTARKTPLSTT